MRRAAQPQPRKPRTPALIDRVRRHQLELVNCNSYLPADLVRLAKIAGIDRDAVLRMLNDSISEVGEWPENVVPITGMSGVIAQMLRDHFATQDLRPRFPEPVAASTSVETKSVSKRRRAS